MTAPRLPAWADARRILCVRLDNLGDVLMTTPALAALRESAPGRRLTLLTSRGAAVLGGGLSDVAEVIAWNAPWSRTAAEAGSDIPAGTMVEQLSRQRFDAAVIFTVYSQNPLPAALLCLMAGIPLRLAYCRENAYALLTHWVEEREPARHSRHEVRRQLDLVATVQAHTADERLRYRVRAGERLSVRVALNRLLPGETGRGYLVAHPGASAASRRWPAERFGRAAALLAEASGMPVIVTGSEDEAPLVERVCATSASARVHAAAGRFRVGELAALIEGARLLVSNNSGPVHLACAVGTPVVALYALTNPQHTPWLTPHRTLFHDVPCRYCHSSVCAHGHHACLENVTAESAAAAGIELLRGGGSRGADAMPAAAAWTPLRPLATAAGPAPPDAAAMP